MDTVSTEKFPLPPLALTATATEKRREEPGGEGERRRWSDAAMTGAMRRRRDPRRAMVDPAAAADPAAAVNQRRPGSGGGEISAARLDPLGRSRAAPSCRAPAPLAVDTAPSLSPQPPRPAMRRD